MLRFVADVLNGVPSITWGVVVYGLVVLRFKSFSAYAGGLALGLMMIPLIMRTTEEVMLLVPNGYREAALALGVSRWKTIVHIVMKTASKGIITGILLALARVAGETAPLLFTAFGNRFWNHSLQRTDRRAAVADFYLRDFTVRRLASPGLGRCAGSRRHDFSDQYPGAISHPRPKIWCGLNDVINND